VKMNGPYDWVPPNYWLADDSRGGAHGFATEISPGAAVPPVESLKRMLPADHLWPIDEVWNYHAGGGQFRTIQTFTDALTARYGLATSLDDYALKAQLMTYEGERAMFEAYARNQFTSTGVIQWMLNNAWPSMIWHLYDYYLRPGGGYFGTKKACEPVHVQYSYDDHSVAVVNGLPRPLKGLQATARLYDLDAREITSREAPFDAPPDSSTRVLALPAAESLPTTYFLRLQLRDAEHLLSDNFYWLSTKPDVMEWEKTKGTAYTPQSAYADLRALARLPAVKLAVEAKPEGSDRDETTVRVTLRNPGPALAFLVRARLTKGKAGEDLTPIFWDDNYVSLLPGEARTLTARYEVASLAGKEPVVEVDGWNVEPAPR